MLGYRTVPVRGARGCHQQNRAAGGANPIPFTCHQSPLFESRWSGSANTVSFDVPKVPQSLAPDSQTSDSPFLHPAQNANCAVLINSRPAQVPHADEKVPQ